MLDAEEPRGDAPGAVEAPPLRGEAVFERVSFAYPGGPTDRRAEREVGPGLTAPAEAQRP
jgi:hypothetical protein